MATVRFTDQTKKISYEYEIDGADARALSQIYTHLSLYPADAVDLVWSVVADEGVEAPDTISPVTLPHSAVHQFGVASSKADHQQPIQMQYSGMMHSIRDQKKLTIRVLSQIS